MKPIYHSLAQHLDSLPGGYPSTESGVELRILKRLFTPGEAEIAGHLTLMPESAAAIAQRIGADEADLASKLMDMSRKGLILRLKRKGETRFMAAQFMVGIWEYHVNDLDEGLIRDVNEYLPYLTKAQEQLRTQQLRVIPINKSLTAEIKVMPYEQAEEIIRQQSKIVVAPCICRKEHQMVGEGCEKPLESCLVFGGGAHYYEGNGIGRTISQKEALHILQQGADSGLVLQPGNAKKPSNICMCCGCCCQVLKMLKRSDKPAQIACTSYYAVVDEESCIGCGDCKDRCQMEALVVDEVAQVDLGRCIGCGLCVPSCDVDAIFLEAKEEGAQWVPPANVIETYLTIAKERGKL
ncbi:Ferredoxin [Olavius algarvensis associated proteobacterium Delta 3]|nr:Ferredoxin [Olavius algarvensis associated proteobacterium Delta 3]CAB5123142.1 Ferredoxin [Olavius algarvensis associated proteobacterium Delta 3]